jgi:hypothetical protein
MPKNIISLKDLKLQEFEDRKKLLHPYTRDTFISNSENPTRVANLEKKVRMKDMHTFTISYNRHEGQYSKRVSDSKEFPKSYKYSESFVDMTDDPDWFDK